MPGLENVHQVELTTPFGPPSDPYVTGRIGDLEVVFLARHGKGHRILPSELNYRANIYGMKTLGVDHLLSVSTAGSMKEAIKPGDLVVPDQFLDRTHKRPATFFGEGIVAHVSLADPVCADLAGDLFAASREAGATTHSGGTYLCIEGPQFSSRAESNLYRSWGVDVISMTAMQEARLAKEAELCYATLVLVTDYDCWHQSVKAVDIGEILRGDARQRRAGATCGQKSRGGGGEARSHLQLRQRPQRCHHHGSRGDSAQTHRRPAPDYRQISLAPEHIQIA